MLVRQAVQRHLESWVQGGVTQFPGLLPSQGFNPYSLAAETQAAAAARLGELPSTGAAKQGPGNISQARPTESSSDKLKGSETLPPSVRQDASRAPTLFAMSDAGALGAPTDQTLRVIAAEIEMPKRKMNLDERAAELKVISAEVAKCTRCPELASTRTQTVFGVGSASPRLVFLGEAPGADEDKQGEPFVGRAGQLLNNIITACKMKREEVYILNTIKCRPPGNRNPLPEEMLNCRGYLDRQFAILQPEYICCLGAVATRALFENPLPLGKMRGKFYDFRGAKVMITYHPAYLLRNPAMKKETWEDMKMLLKEMGISL